MPDFRCSDHGSICLLTPLTTEAHEWTEEHVPEASNWFAGGFAVEPRFLEDIVTGIRDHGLTVEGE